MKAKNLKMEELLDFKPAEGKILLNGARILIMNADAMGKLRQDLISTLGMERAKGFLIRYGWSCGHNDAISNKEQYDWDNDMEWILAGPTMHTIEGIAKVVIGTVQINLEEKGWLRKNIWFNSFEVEQHLKYFGLHDSPVCWILVGYAGGYASVICGQRVIYKEIKCVGKGDAMCEVIGKTVEEWGDEIESELPYYEELKISEELEAAHERINHQHRILQRAFNVNQKLTNLVLNGEGLPGITQTLAQIVNGTVLVFDRNIQILANYPPENTLNFQREIEEYLNLNLVTSTDRNEYATLIKEKKPLNVDLRLHNETHSCMIVPIIVGDDIIGFIAVVQQEQRDPKLDLIMAIERSANVYALEIIKQKTVYNLEQQLRGDFLDTLMSGNYSDAEALVAWGLRLGHRISGPHSVMVIALDNYDNLKYDSVEKVLSIKTEVLQISSSFIRVDYPSALCGKTGEEIIIILPNEGTVEKNKTRNYIVELETAIKQRFPRLSISVGVGRVVNKVADFAQSYQQGLKALSVIRLFEQQGTTVFFDDLGSMAVLLEARNKREILDYMDKKLGRLLEYDQKYNATLIKTLEIYLNNDTIQKTAKEIALSVSGLKYRLNKIIELGYDLQSPQERFDLQFALNILKISGLV